MSSAIRVLFDTNAIIAWIERDPTFFKPELLELAPVISLISVGELMAGAEKSSRPAENKNRFMSLLTAFEVLEFDLRTAEVYGSLLASLRKLGKPIPTNDAWIAAQALCHGLPVLTRDHHFSFIPSLVVRTW
ncbi:PIN domain-containing protein [bacterium]|nr:PIN domain-containing protein [bacterium]